MKKTIIFFISFFVFFLKEASTVTANPLQNYCQQDSLSGFVPELISDSSKISYYSTSIYLNKQNEAALLMVLKPNTGSNFKLQSLLKTGQVSVEKQCPGTSNYQFVSFKSDMLFVVDPLNSYYVCKYDQASDTLQVKQLDNSGPLFNDFLKMLPYHVRYSGSTIQIYAAVNYNAGTGTQIVKYEWNAQTMLPLAGLAVNDPTKLITPQLPLNQLKGSLVVFNQPQGNKIIILNTNSPAEYIINRDIFPQDSEYADTVAIFTFMSFMTILVTTYQYCGSGTGWKILDDGTVTQISEMNVSGQNTIKDYSNNLYSMGRITNDKLIWNFMRLTDGTLVTKVILNPADNGANVLSVSFSQNKAIVYASSGKFSVYRINDDNSVDTLFNQKSFTENLTYTDKQYKISLKCGCQQPSQYNCYSSSLACLVIKKALTFCKSPLGETTVISQ